MLPSLQLGDRVRLTIDKRRGEALHGDCGTILEILPPPVLRGETLYRVGLDRDTGMTCTGFFFADELERLH
jgi:hypothetical protein